MEIFDLLWILFACLPLFGSVVASGASESAAPEAPPPGEPTPPTMESDGAKEEKAGPPIHPDDEIIGKIVAGSDKLQKIEAAKAGKAQVKGKVPTTAGISDSSGTNETALSDPADVLLKELEALEGKPEQPPQEENPLEGVEPESRAATRIQSLVARAKQTEAQAQEAQQRAWEYHNAYQQIQTQALQREAAMREELAALKARVEMFSQYQQQQPTEQDPVKKLQEDWLKKQSEVTKRELKPLYDELEAQKKQFTEMQRKAQLNQIKRQNDFVAEKAMREVLLKGLDEETYNREAPDTKRLLYAYAVDRNLTDLGEAAKLLRARDLRMAVALMRANAKGGKRIAEQKARIPQPAPRGRPGTEGEGEPSYEEIRSDGRFKDLADWAIHGSPPLHPRKR